MFREMRRFRQQMSGQECAELLEQGISGVLAVSGDGGYPYAVPVGYACLDGKLYFHCAQAGHKLDAVRRDGRVSFCVVGEEHVVPEKFTILYRSVIVFGRMAEVTGEAEKRAAAEAIAKKYSPLESEAARGAEIENAWRHLCVLCLSPERITGKQSMAYVNGAPKKTAE